LTQPSLPRPGDIADPAAAEVLPQIRAVVTDSDAGLSRDLLARLPALAIATCASAGHESLDVEAIRERGIAVDWMGEASRMSSGN
jgi:lactate dehydrogenase-like 2-hydroxyacid dehydrogenase